MTKKLVPVVLGLILSIIFAGHVIVAPANAVGDPGSHLKGRVNFAMAFMAYRGDAAFNRLSEVTLNGDGTLKESYWSWSADMAPSVAQNPNANRVQVGTTTGCFRSCPVWAPVKWDKSPASRSGNWHVSVTNGVPYLVLTFNSSNVETYRINDRSGLTELVLTSVRGRTLDRAYGRGYGSLGYKGFSVSRDLASMRMSLVAPVSLPQNIASKRWGAAGTLTGTQNYDLSKFSLCATGSGCMALAPVPGAEHRYLHLQAGTRKVSLLTMVAANFPNGTDTTKTCIPERAGGHQRPALQILADDGRFRGLVGVEASLYRRDPAGNYIGLWVVVAPGI